MKARLLLTASLTLAFAAGIGVGLLAARAHIKQATPSEPLSENVASQSDTDDPSDGCRIGYRVSDDFYSDVPKVERWLYPGSKITCQDGGGGGSIGVIEWANEKRLIMTTPDAIDKVWAYYKKEFALREEGDMSGLSFGLFTNEPGKVTFWIDEELEKYNFPLPKSDHIQVKLFSMGSHRYHVVVCMFRGKKDEVTSVAVAYRKNKEALSMIRHLAKTNP
jgi:hypothetical protein